MSFETFQPISPAETRLLDGLSHPERTVFAGGELPEKSDEDCLIRAEFLRAVLLDPDTRVDAKGIRLRGAWVKGALDLQGASLPFDLTFSSCHFSDDLNLVNAQLRGVHFSACHLTDISADNTRFSGSLYLRGDSLVEGEVALAGARIEGDLQFCGLRIESQGQDAIFAPGLRVDGSIYLGNYPYSDTDSALFCDGAIFLSSARVTHDVFITRTSISRMDEISNAVFGATEEHGAAIALSLARAHVHGILYLSDNQISSGIVNLAGAQVARLRDEPAGPGASYPLRLDGFIYSDFSRHTDTSVYARLDWLARRPEDMPFSAQPYEHLASILSTLGHRSDEKTVLMHKERLLRAENRRLMHGRGSWLKYAISVATEPVLRFTVGYGYRPARALFISTLLILFLGWYFGKAWDAGDMAPDAGPLLVSAGWVSATETHADNPAAFWSAPGQAGQDYETFHPFAYAADLMVPIINLGQESAWAPSTSRSPWGWHGWWIRWFAKLAGWVITALAAGALTGMIRND